MLVPPAEAHALGLDIGAFCAVECSALTQDGVRNIFDKVAQAALSKPQTEEKKRPQGRHKYWQV